MTSSFVSSIFDLDLNAITKVLSYIPTHDRINFTKTCKRFHELLPTEPDKLYPVKVISEICCDLICSGKQNSLLKIDDNTEIKINIGTEPFVIITTTFWKTKLCIKDTFDIKNTLIKFFDMNLSEASKKSIAKNMTMKGMRALLHPIKFPEDIESLFRYHCSNETTHTMKTHTLMKFQSGTVTLNTSQLYEFLQRKGVDYSSMSMEDIKEIVLSFI